MEVLRTETKISVLLTNSELWYLVKLNAPGVVVGINNPYEGMADEEIIKKESESLESLMKSGIVQYGKNQRIEIDDFINGMVYSCMHSDHILEISDDKYGGTYIHFLSNWQMIVRCVNEFVEMTIYRDPQDLWEYIKDFYLPELSSVEEEGEIIVLNRDLEIATYLYQNNNSIKAIEILSSDLQFSKSYIETFLAEITKLKREVEFTYTYNHNSPENVNQYWFKIILGPSKNYWITKVVSTIEAVEYLKFEIKSDKSIKENILKTFPKYN